MLTVLSSFFFSQTLVVIAILFPLLSHSVEVSQQWTSSQQSIPRKDTHNPSSSFQANLLNKQSEDDTAIIDSEVDQDNADILTQLQQLLSTSEKKKQTRLSVESKQDWKSLDISFALANDPDAKPSRPKVHESNKIAKKLGSENEIRFSKFLRNIKPSRMSMATNISQTMNMRKSRKGSSISIQGSSSGNLRGFVVSQYFNSASCGGTIMATSGMASNECFETYAWSTLISYKYVFTQCKYTVVFVLG